MTHTTSDARKRLAEERQTAEAVNEAMALVHENNRLRDALTRLAKSGIHADCNPTVSSTNPPDYAWWSNYLRNADMTVRQIARDALSADDSPTPDGYCCDRCRAEERE